MAQQAARQLAHRCPVAFTQGSRKVHVQVPFLKDRELFRPIRTDKKIQLADRMGLFKCSASSNGATHGTLQCASHKYRDLPWLCHIQKKRTQHSVKPDVSHLMGVKTIEMKEDAITQCSMCRTVKKADKEDKAKLLNKVDAFIFDCDGKLPQ